MAMPRLPSGSPSRKGRFRLPARIGLALSLMLALGACAARSPERVEAPEESVDGMELLVLVPEGSLPEDLLEEAARRAGLVARLERYSDPALAVDALRAERAIDLAILPTEALPTLISDGLLAPFAARALPVFRDIEPSFRDLSYDPDNRYSLPFRYGSTGLIAHMDALSGLPRRWDDLWTAAHGGSVAAYDRPLDLVGAALLAAGQPVAEPPPEAMAAAVDRIAAMDPPVRLAPLSRRADLVLAPGGASLLIGRPTELRQAKEAGLDVLYILPEEGALVWAEHLVLPAAGSNVEHARSLSAELLRASLAAKITEATQVASTNLRARSLLPPALADDPLIHPSAASLRRARLQAPLSAAGQVLLENLWQDLRSRLAQRGS